LEEARFEKDGVDCVEARIGQGEGEGKRKASFSSNKERGKRKVGRDRSDCLSRVGDNAGVWLSSSQGPTGRRTDRPVKAGRHGGRRPPCVRSQQRIGCASAAKERDRWEAAR